MDPSITILRELWRHRVAVAVIAVVSVLAGVLLAFKPGLPPQSRKYDVGVGHVQILVDTPASQVVEVDPKGSDTLGSRASILANLMIEGDVKAAIAKRAHLRPNQLLATSDSAIQPATVTPDQLSAPGIHLIKTSVLTNDAGAQLPIIGVDTQAPTALEATALANAAVAGLGDYLNTKAATEAVPDAKRVQVRGLGGASGREESRGPGALLGVVIIILLFCMLCGGMLVVLAAIRAWRSAAESEARGEFEGEVYEYAYEEYPPDLWLEEPAAGEPPLLDAGPLPDASR